MDRDANTCVTASEVSVQLSTTDCSCSFIFIFFFNSPFEFFFCLLGISVLLEPFPQIQVLSDESVCRLQYVDNHDTKVIDLLLTMSNNSLSHNTTANVGLSINLLTLSCLQLLLSHINCSYKTICRDRTCMQMFRSHQLPHLFVCFSLPCFILLSTKYPTLYSPTSSFGQDGHTCRLCRNSKYLYQGCVIQTICCAS